MGLNHDQTLAAMTANDPPIFPMQRWVLRSEEDQIMRSIRIVALHPEPHGKGVGHESAPATQWIYREEPVHGLRELPVELRWMPEYSLRRLFTLAEPSFGITDEKLELPRQVIVENGPGESAAVQIIQTPADIDRIVRDLHGCIRVLEGIGHFAGGTAADEATNQLQRMGVWGKEAA